MVTTSIKEEKEFIMSHEPTKIKPGLPLKGVATALLFSVFLGPVGLLYASSIGGITMIILGFIVACSKLWIPILWAWLICCIWSVLAVNQYNKKIIEN